MMKMLIIVTLISFCCRITYSEDLETPYISVLGTATTMVVPNQMVWSITVKNQGDNLSDVAEKHTEIVENVLQLLTELAVPDKEIQTARMNFGESYEQKNFSLVKKGYFASTSIFFLIEDFQKYKLLWIGLSQIENVSIENVNYDHSKRIDFQNETRIKALLAAKKKADVLANTLGSQIGELLIIDEDSYLQRSNTTPNMLSNVIEIREDDLNMEEGLVPGKIPIRIRIRVVFRLITLKE